MKKFNWAQYKFLVNKLQMPGEMADELVYYYPEYTKILIRRLRAEIRANSRKATNKKLKLL